MKKIETVLITGASGGIGSAIAKRFAANGYNVAVHYNSNKNAATELCACIRAAGGTAEMFHADLLYSSEIDKMISEVAVKFGEVDVLVNNAGVSLIKLFDDTTEEEWDKVMNVNLKAAFLCSKAVVKNMIHNKKGKIINISSIWGVNGASCEVAYSASKAGLIGFTKALAQELAPACIQVNCVTPGVISTKMNSVLKESEIEALCDSIPIGRFGIPDEVAGAVLYFASPDSGYTTGQVLGVDGGWY